MYYMPLYLWFFSRYCNIYMYIHNVIYINKIICVNKRSITRNLLEH